MAKKKSETGQLSETPQERALIDMTLQRYQQYKEKWEPVQQQAIAMVEKMGKAGSMERQRAVSREAGGVGLEFDEASRRMDDVYSNRGIRMDSGSAKIGTEKMQTARAGAQGIAAGESESEIDRAYVESLTSIMAAGRNQAEQAIGSQAAGASLAANDQAVRMKAKAARRASVAKFLTQGVSAAGAAFGPSLAGGPSFTGGNGSGTEAMGTGAAPGEGVGSFTGRF